MPSANRGPIGESSEAEVSTVAAGAKNDSGGAGVSCGLRL